MKEERPCTICEEPQTDDCFYKHAPYKGKRSKRNQCITCVRKRNRERFL